MHSFIHAWMVNIQNKLLTSNNSTMRSGTRTGTMLTEQVSRQYQRYDLSTLAPIKSTSVQASQSELPNFRSTLQ